MSSKELNKLYKEYEKKDCPKLLKKIQLQVLGSIDSIYAKISRSPYESLRKDVVISYTLEKFFKAVESKKITHSASALLSTIVKRKFLNEVSNAKTRSKHFVDIGDDPPDNYRDKLALDGRPRVDCQQLEEHILAVDYLNPFQKAIVIEHTLGDKQLQEVAKSYGKKDVAARVAHYRAKKKMAGDCILIEMLTNFEFDMAIISGGRVR